MLTQEQAETIVEDSVEAVGGGNYASDKPLESMGIIADPVLARFKRKIRGDDVGVQKYGHVLSANKLDGITKNSLGGEVENIVRDNSLPAKPKVISSKKPSKQPKLEKNSTSGSKKLTG